MFERGSGSRQGPVEVEIAFQDGQRLNGIVVLPPGRTLPEVLNGAATFMAGNRNAIAAGQFSMAKTCAPVAL